ncbi:MBL fold metallo-hydrolase [Sphingomonas sp. A2-49]|uniref:MBL fold metallo-hydrolase n=1 Tax=Sphingomonas sp. A2-49 TaxID=1391375 RepID=UPI0021CEF24E|nr:MBL fold metallo-hydrolase [Sphingomonas sp. A2-49]MCU6453429.1 MBL fold metallo-hydrolase [Sphingomonas sp. A2-49]
MIKTMLAFRPELSKQAVLSYFTRPGRDLNHRLIAEIAGGRWSHIPAAPVQATLAYMAQCLGHPYPLSGSYADDEESTDLTRLATMELTWWPVGQGLFMSGRLFCIAGGQFNWVYDCGSTSGAAERDRAIATFRSRLAGRRLDLVVLSHFDSDHINGIVRLIRGTPVRTLLLPYVPLWQRLLIALGEGIGADNALLDFYLDPAAYLAGIDGSEIDEIVFVPGAGPDDIAPGSEDEPDPDRPIEGGKVEYGPPPQGSEGDPALAGQANVQVRTLAPGGRIIVPSLWEFVPYNDAAMQPLADAFFVVRVKRVAGALLAGRRRQSVMLRLLKRIYQRTFGSGSVPANIISLFLYAGPIGTRIRFDPVAGTAPFRINLNRDNLAQLATGDGFLDTPARLVALQRFYVRNRRLDRAGLLQVMHHGARPNWQPGLAAVLKPAASIFSSDPDYTHAHPAPEVLRDFWSWCPVRVDKVTGFSLVANLELR